jgi:CheY-like chemotaxis protein
LRVLVAEDTATNRVLLGAMLGRHGHEVSFAEDGAEAVRLVQARTFDIVLMDVRMPVMDGVEATRQIRALPAPVGSMPILGLTANVLQDDRRAYEAAGMNRVLMKPVAWKDLFAAMAEVTTAD